MKKFLRRVALNSLILILFFSLFSCNSYENVNKDYNIKDVKLFDKSTSLNITKPLKISFSGEITAEKNYKINGYFKIYSDSIYQLVVYSKNIGIELFRIENVKDSLLFINRLNKEYSYRKQLKINQINEFKIDGTELLKLMFGRLLNYENLVKVTDNSLYFNYQGLNGECNLNKLALLENFVLSKDSLIISSDYMKYNRRYELPMFINASIKNDSEMYFLSLNMNSITTIKSDFKAFKINTNYTKL